MAPAGTVAIRSSIRTLSYGVIRVDFTVDVPVNADLLNKDNYVISVVTVGADPVEVAVVRDPGSELVVDYVDLELTRPTMDAIYSLELTNLLSTENLELVDTLGYFRGRTTKMDSMQRVFPSMYNVKSSSNLGSILMAMSIEDERMGGQADITPKPTNPLAAGASTFGTGTAGTSTFGG